MSSKSRAMGVAPERGQPPAVLPRGSALAKELIRRADRDGRVVGPRALGAGLHWRCTARRLEVRARVADLVHVVEDVEPKLERAIANVPNPTAPGNCKRSAEPEIADVARRGEVRCDPAPEAQDGNETEIA